MVTYMANKNEIGMPRSLLDGIDPESFIQIFTADKNKEIKFKDDDKNSGYLNSVTKEPYVGCGLAGTNLVEDVLPALYYNSKIDPPKPVLLTGESGTGKTTIGECFIQNFANADIRTIQSGNDAAIMKEKRSPILRIQNYSNIMNEDVVGEWDAIRMIHAEKGENTFNKEKFFRLGALTRGLYKQEDPDFAGRGVLLDELSRADENTLNVYLEPLRERKVTVGGNCFGECEYGIKKSRFHVVATQNEGDAGTIDLPSAMQTRFSRIPVDFIPPESEQELLQKTISGLTDNEAVIATAVRMVPCLTSHFRGIGKGSRALTVKPSIKDTTDMGKVIAERGATSIKMRDAKVKADIEKTFVSILGKNPADAGIVKEELGKGICRT